VRVCDVSAFWYSGNYLPPGNYVCVVVQFVIFHLMNPVLTC